MDDEVVELMPVLREFVDAVNRRDKAAVEAALRETPAATLAVLAAGWVGDRLNECDRLRGLLEEESRLLAEKVAALDEMTERRDELRGILHGREGRKVAA